MGQVFILYMIYLCYRNNKRIRLVSGSVADVVFIPFVLTLSDDNYESHFS